MDLPAAFQIVSKLIENENTLIGNRVNWLLVFHGLLFTAFFSALKLKFEKELSQSLTEYRNIVHYSLLLLCAVGLISPVIAAASVYSAELQLSAMNSWWEAQKAILLTQPGNGYLKDLPPIATQGFLGIKGSHLVSLLSLVWLVLSLLLLRAAKR